MCIKFYNHNYHKLEDILEAGESTFTFCFELLEKAQIVWLKELLFE